MKNLSSTLIILPFLFLSCFGVETTNEIEDDIQSDLDDEQDLHLTELLVQSEAVEFAPYNGVERYNNNEKLVLKDYNPTGGFYYGFPVEHELEETQKDDHTLMDASEVFNGTIYDISIRDYSGQGEDVVDAGFTKFMHAGLVEHMLGEAKFETEVKSDQGAIVFYTCYSYDLGDHVYMCDQLTFGFNDYIVHLSVTSRPNFESASRVLDYINAFEVVP